MITIREDSCKKLPGITSLFISFSFNQEIINLLKNCDAYIFDKKTLEWEVPINSLSYVLDNLVYYDDITLNLLKDKETETNVIKPSLSYKLKPFDYQMEGITYGLNKDRWLLLDAPGLGKTAQIIHIAEELKASRGLKHCLIICGVASLKTNWKSEIEKHSNLSCKILGERVTRTGSKVIDSVEKRAEQLKNNIDEFFIITNIETFRSDGVLEAFKTGANEIDMIVVDEIHKCLDGDTIIETDCGQLSLKNIVENNIKCKILSYNEDNKIKEYQNVINYYKTVTLQTIELKILHNNEIITIRCTFDHKILTSNRGYVEAQYLTENDDIVVLN
jgi:hypothetical protein